MWRRVSVAAVTDSGRGGAVGQSDVYAGMQACGPRPSDRDRPLLGEHRAVVAAETALSVGRMIGGRHWPLLLELVLVS